MKYSTLPIRFIHPLRNILALLLFIPALLSAQFEDDDSRVLNEYIVMLKPGHTIEQLLNEPAFVSQVVNKERLSKRMSIFLLERTNTNAPDEFLLSLRRNQHIKLAQFNHRVKERSVIPNDTDFGLQWNMLNTGQNSGVPGADIEATEAWAINNGNLTINGDTIVVAIVDKLFDLNHEDINYFVNYNEVAGNGIDDDGNGYIDDVKGWNAKNNNGDVGGIGNTTNHATHCSGIAGAIGDNNTGVAGVCWGVKILPVYGSAPQSDVATVIKGYDYVINMRALYNNTFGTQGAFIVATNSSFGADNLGPNDSPIWCAMYDTMGYEGILSATATSNSNVNVDITHDMPTECPSKWMIAVTNTTRNDMGNSAGYGKISIDLGAPGTGIQSTVYGGYSAITGTSMAAPHVAGTVAAMYAAACKGLIDKYYEEPDTIALLMRDYLLQAAEWIPAMNNITVTNGRLNLYRAVMNLRQFNCDSCNFNLELEKVPISCKGAGNGAMAVHSDSLNILNANVLWSNGLTTPECLNMEPGYYTVLVTDTATGCRRFIAAELHNPDTIKINAVTVNPPVNGNPGSLTINTSAGNEPLLFSIDGITWQTTPTFSIPTEGSYTVYVKNTTGCIVGQTVIVSDINDLSSSLWQLSIYPNPANDEVTIASSLFADAKTPLQVFDIAGRKVVEVIPATSIYHLSTIQWNAGLYFIKVKGIERKLAITR